MGDLIRHQRLATPAAPRSLAEKRSQLEELRAQAMFSDSDLISRRIRDLEAQIEQETRRRAAEPPPFAERHHPALRAAQALRSRFRGGPGAA